jgi:predicted enzyme related to lactoylglutathione lyase
LASHFIHDHTDGVKGSDLPVKEMGGAANFYRTVFDWDIERVEGSRGVSHSVQTIECDERGRPSQPGAINGGLFRRSTYGFNGTFLEIGVASLDRTIELVVEKGGSIIRPKMPFLDLAHYAVIEDSEGNTIGLWEDR